MAAYCNCAGKFFGTVDQQSFKELLVTFKSISHAVGSLYMYLCIMDLCDNRDMTIILGK